MVRTGRTGLRFSAAVPRVHSNARLLLVRILSRYFVARFLRYFVAIFVASALGIATVEMLLNFDDMLKGGHGTEGVVTYLLLRIPSYYLRELVPICTFAAAFTTLGLAARWFESTAAKAGGISPYRLILPVLVGHGKG